MQLKLSLAAVLAAGGVAMAAMPAHAQTVSFERLLKADSEPQNWLLYGQNYKNWRYSGLTQVNKTNVQNLKMAFLFSIGRDTKADGAEEGTPLVEDGFMYVTNTWSKLMKVDVRSGTKGQPVWRFDPKSEFTRSNKGPALLGDNVYITTNDVRLFAINKSTGEPVWEKNMVSPTESNTQRTTPGPLVVKNLVMQSESTGGQSGTRSWIAAADAATGDLKWRFHTIPAPGEPGNETWKDDHNAWRTGGAALWATGSYDPALKTTYWGTANPVPMFDPEYRPGDNLFTNSIIGFDVGSGKMNWYFQYTANESWDYDEIGIHFLYDRTVNGETRKVVGHFARNGFFYQFDRTNGQFLSAGQYVNQVTWTKGIDPKTGKPVEYNPALALQTYLPETRQTRAQPKINVCPSMLGGLRWQPPAYNATKQVAYAAGMEGCSDIEVQPVAPVGPQGGNPKGVNQTFLGGAFSSKTTGSIVAVDEIGRTHV